MDDSTKRIIRTLFQSILAVSTVLLTIVPMVLDAFEAALSPQQYAVLVGGAASVVAVAGAVARFMQAPAVIGFIDTYAPWLSANSRPDEHLAPQDPADEPTVVNDSAE